MLFGPVFTREAATAPRRVRFYATRTIFVAALFGLMVTSWQILIGSQLVSSPGDWARFGSAVFQILAPLQVAVALPFSALLAAAAVSQEKDRRTLILLLMTNLSNGELVLGKLLASMLTVLVVIVAAFPLFMISAAMGGVSHAQILRVFAVTLTSALAAGSLGSTISLWREKTFQSLAITALVLVLWLVGWEIAASGALAEWIPSVAPATWQTWAIMMSPWQAVQAAARPDIAAEVQPGQSAHVLNYALVSGVGLAALLNGVAIAMVRVWNPSREARPQTADEREGTVFESASIVTAETGDAALDSADQPASRHTAEPTTAVDVHRAGGRVRRVWDNPILWRETCTWAYGKKIVAVRLAYLCMFAVSAAALVGTITAQDDGIRLRQVMPTEAQPLTPLLVVSIVLLNALAVTSLTNERDGRALDLLLVTDLTPKEIIFGKLGGAFYNAKEMVILPVVLCGIIWWTDRITTENFVFLIIGMSTMYGFAAMLGLHAGMTYANSRTAIATSIGTLLFLFLGVATCMRIMLAFGSSFQNQLFSFLSVVVGGGVALYGALGLRNPSRAMGLAFIPAPFCTFFAMTSFLLGQYGLVFIVTVATYGFATLAMLKPAVAEFDVAIGRTGGREE